MGKRAKATGPKPTAFPSELYVAYAEEGTEDEFLRTEVTAEGFADTDEPVRVARYRLVETLEVATKVVTTVKATHE